MALALSASWALQGPVHAGAAAPTEYYVALGDSLAAGVGASTYAQSYVNLVYTHELATFPGLVQENLSCSGATTTSLIEGPGCSYSTGTQLGDAEAFLRAHQGQVAFVTIDIGANDVDGCVSGSSINETCFLDGLAAVQANVPTILQGLEAADPGVRIVGMTYYDPFLAAWLEGSSGQTLAQESVVAANELNDSLTTAYDNAHAATADVASAFATADFDLTGSYDNMTLPQNVANVCNWTLMCTEDNIHANDAGHQVLAQTFDTALDTAVAPYLAPKGSVTFTEGAPSSFTVAPVAWPKASLTETGTLPTGVTFSDDGDGTATVAGTPLDTRTGTYNVVVKASNGVGRPAVEHLAVVVDEAPTIVSSDTATFRAGHHGLFKVRVGPRYPSAVTITSTGSLPAGLSFVDGGHGSASLSGTPAAGSQGTYALEVTATNACGSATETLTVSVT